MAKEERLLAIDIGATSIKICEFEFSDPETPMLLTEFAYREYEEELSDETRASVVTGLLRQMLAEGNFSAKKAFLSLPGQSALIRFARLPIVEYDRKQIRKMAEFEATNNIPFPIEDVIWDYQLILQESEQIDVLSVVIKNEIVDQLARAVSAVGCDPFHIDIAPIACYNAARANGIGKDESVIILNMGGRSTSLLFAEGDHFFARTIPTAGHTITQQIAKEFNIGLSEAEELKRRHGFVALGGAYAEPESETAASVSKITRMVMARMYGEITRSINVYKTNQHGNQPVKMYLTGGSSILNYCDVFFQEKLGIPVEYFNPFGVVQIAPDIDRTKLESVAHMFSETIGLALRYAETCPVEIDLIPKAVANQRRLTQKTPLFIVSGLLLILTLGVLEFGIRDARAAYDNAADALKSVDSALTALQEMEAKQGEISGYKAKNDELEADLMKKCLLPSIYHEIALLRPDYLTITSIKPVYAPEPLDFTMIEEAAADVGAEGADGGTMTEDTTPAMDISGEGTEAEMETGEKYNTQERVIYGFEIVGFSYMPSRGTPAWSPVQQAWTDFTGIAPLSLKDLDKKEGEDGTSTEGTETPAATENQEGGEEKPAVPEKPVAELAKEQFAKVRGEVVKQTTPEQTFIRALLASPLFDETVNPKFTVTTNPIYRYPKQMNLVRIPRQISSFKILVKLQEPAQISYTEYTAKDGGNNANTMN